MAIQLFQTNKYLNPPTNETESNFGWLETAKKIGDFLTSCEGIMYASILLAGAGIAIVLSGKTVVIMSCCLALIVALRILCFSPKLGNLSEAQVHQLSKNYLTHMMGEFGLDDLCQTQYGKYIQNPDSKFMEAALPILKEKFLQNKRQFIFGLREVFEKIETNYGEETVSAILKRASKKNKAKNLLLEFTLKIEEDNYSLEVESLYLDQGKYFPIRTWGLNFNEREWGEGMVQRLTWLDRPSRWEGGRSLEEFHPNIVTSI